MLNFDADVKKTTARHQCKKPLMNLGTQHTDQPTHCHLQRLKIGIKQAELRGTRAAHPRVSVMMQDVHVGRLLVPVRQGSHERCQRAVPRRCRNPRRGRRRGDPRGGGGGSQPGAGRAGCVTRCVAVGSWVMLGPSSLNMSMRFVDQTRGAAPIDCCSHTHTHTHTHKHTHTHTHS